MRSVVSDIICSVVCVCLSVGHTVWAGTRKVKPIWILLKQETVSDSDYQLGHMQVCTLLQTDNLSVIYRPDALFASQLTGSKHWRL